MITRIEYISDDLARKAVASYTGPECWFVRAKSGTGHDIATWANLPSRATAQQVCRYWVDHARIVCEPEPSWMSPKVQVATEERASC